MTIEGHVEPGFERVREAFEQSFSSGEEVGASFAAVKNGRALVDLWGGHADRARTRPWQRDTLINVYSTTKGMAALVCSMLVDKIQLDYEDVVVDHWPEFGEHGKQDLTVAELLSHQAGLCAVREPVTVLDFCDPDKINALLLAQKPLFEPGSASGYHALTFGPLVGELVRRIDGRSLGTFFREEIAQPLGADFIIGLPESEDGRVAEMIAMVEPPEFRALDMSEIQQLTFGNPETPPEVPNERAWRAAEIPSANGQANAAGIAKIYDVLAHGGVAGGTRLMREPAILSAAESQRKGRDLVLGVETDWACGFLRNGASGLYGPNPDSFGHSGYGGSFGFADRLAAVGVGYAMNQMRPELVGDPRATRLIAALYESL
ncbi:MAG: serine hydrolase domain-containing protein [Myxococcota bacterium]|nr:serine hydrolase domain-containing protein [Myxococcota bacterium]